MATLDNNEVKSAVDKGFNIWFADQELEAYCPARHSLKEDGASIGVGEQLDFIVIEFNSDTRRVLVSHTQNFKNVDSNETVSKKKKSSLIFTIFRHSVINTLAHIIVTSKKC